ncbi:MAG: hypothetical protein M0Z27_02295 [Thermaerobacter sp.]|nr:hypothetical protein [Thermaerobacter sp.]
MSWTEPGTPCEPRPPAHPLRLALVGALGFVTWQVGIDTANRRLSPPRVYLENTLAGVLFGLLSGMSWPGLSYAQFIALTAFLAGLVSTLLFKLLRI